MKGGLARVDSRWDEGRDQPCTSREREVGAGRRERERRAVGVEEKSNFKMFADVLAAGNSKGL